ncbi:hypothetical protein HD806DRAFT_338552 [Xylariaceae sp. AK1471]|nr:hypothetical protein HD806DRAFT_338552 [Xylariaceae sp. AK1471]
MSRVFFHCLLVIRHRGSCKLWIVLLSIATAGSGKPQMLQKQGLITGLRAPPHRSCCAIKRYLPTGVIHTGYNRTILLQSKADCR